MFLLAAPIQQPLIDQLDKYARDRDVAALTQHLAVVPKRNPFNVIKTGGAYAAGGLGWTAKALRTPDGSNYVVFSTPLIEEDMGELLFWQDVAGRLTYVPETDDRGVVLQKHDFDIRFDLEKGLLIAKDRISCKWKKGAVAGGHFFFRISPTYQVTSLTSPAGDPIPFTQAGGIVAVSAGTAPLEYVASYQGSNLMPAFKHQFSPKEATLSGSVWYLSIARQPAPYDMTIHYPKDWIAIAQGDEGETFMDGHIKSTKFHNPLPVCWYGASIGPYKRIVDKIGDREYSVMSQTMSEADMHIQNRLNAAVIDFYSKNFSPYPFKRWTALDSWQFQGGPGALEAYSFATYRGNLPGADAHEPSHTWWGGILNNDYLKSLWNESFANFCAGLYPRSYPDGNKEELSKAFVSVASPFPAYNAAPLSDAGVEIGRPAAALGYGKGAFVLQMLEDDMGTDTMLKCMREWLKSNPARHIGSWEDFEKVVQKVSGQDYKWFFDQWVHRPGYADPKIENLEWHNGFVRGRIKFNGDAYRLRTDVLFVAPDGSQRFERADIVPDSKDTAEFFVKCGNMPSIVSFDPWQKLLRTRSAEEKRATLEGMLDDMSVYIEPNRDDLKPMSLSAKLTAVPADFSGAFLVGSPETNPVLKPLFDRASFTVRGNKLTYKGTTIDLDHGGALAIVDLPNGKHAAIGVGKTLVRPRLGIARLAVFNELGQTLRAETDPVAAGPLAVTMED